TAPDAVSAVDRRLDTQQARQESNLQPPVLECTPSNAGVEGFVDFQPLSSEPATLASLDNAGVGTIPDTENDPSRAASRSETDRILQLGRQAGRVDGPRRDAGRGGDVVRVGEEEVAARPGCPADPGSGTGLARGGGGRGE